MVNWMTLHRVLKQVPFALPAGRNPNTHSVEDWVIPRACLDVLEKRKSHALLGFETQRIFNIVS